MTLVDRLTSNAPGRDSHQLWRIGALGYRWLRAFGLDVPATYTAVRELPDFISQARAYKRAADGTPVVIRPHLQDRRTESGVCSGHYFWQDLLVARRIYETAPQRHVDVGSRIDGFIAHLLAFRSVEVVDIRRLPSTVEGLSFIQDDATSLRKMADHSLESVSSLHALEHFGLGRYGDPIMPDGHLQGMRALERVLAPGGRLWISMPIGQPAVEFNGQRIIHPEQAVKTLESLELVQFTAIPRAGSPVTSMDWSRTLSERGWCGLYEFRAPAEK